MVKIADGVIYVTAEELNSGQFFFDDEPEKEPTGTLRLQVSIGFAVRGTFLRYIRGYCFQAGLTVDIQEQKGWLSSDYYISITGPFNKLYALEQDLNRIQREFGG